MFSQHRARCHLAKTYARFLVSAVGIVTLRIRASAYGLLSSDGLERGIEGDPQCSRSLATLLKLHRLPQSSFSPLSAPPVSANEMIQSLGPVAAHEPILMTVGDKHVI